ncbi:hypothetical protein F4777DRAFT_365194 [Nemania sp. FL0916]|nr:hypothetical protein F4777DRAFT_365194 [Nemania sp. FL0916]
MSGMGFGFKQKQRVPSPAPEPVVREWLDAQGAQIDKALGRRQNAIGDPGGDIEPSPELDSSSQSLRVALKQYQQLDINPRLELDIDNCTWEDVFRCMANAQADYEKKATTWRGCVRKLFRKAGDVADDVDPLLSLIPDEYGLGVLAAGISLIFMLTKTASQNRETILAAFEEIPAIVASAQTKLKLEPKNEAIKACGEKLNLTILTSISELVGSLLPERHARSVPYFWSRRSLSQSGIESVLTRLRNDAEELKGLVQDLLDAAILQTRDVVFKIEGQASVIVDVTSQINGKTEDLKKDAATIIKQNSTLATQNSDLSDRVTSQLEILGRLEANTKKENQIMMRMQRKDEERENSRNFMESVLQEVLTDNRRKEEQILYLSTQLSIARSLTPIQGLMTIDQFLIAISAVDHIEQSTTDAEKILQLRNSIHPAAEADAVSLLQTAVFRDWLLPGRSDAMLIDGAGGAVEFVDHAQRVSATSIMCALLLSQLVRSQPDCFRIYFFCGLHSSEKDALGDGPRGLMRGLLCDLAKEAYRRQLLRLDFIDDKTYRDGLQQQKIGYFCQAFYQILQYMNVGAALDMPIYCVIDGIAQYEKQEWLEDLTIVMGMFRAIVNDTKLKPCFKLFLTSSHRVRYVTDMISLPPSKRLVAKPSIMGENPHAQRGLQSNAEHVLQARRQQIIAQRRGQSQYQDDQYSVDDYA